MASYCKKCLRRVPDGHELCVECHEEARKKEEAFDNMVDLVAEGIEKIKSKRKLCTRCGQPINIVTSTLVKAENAICVKCALEEEEKKRLQEEERKQRLVDERIEKMKNGMSFLHINRVAQLANAMARIKLRLLDCETRESIEVVIINGESIEIDVEGDRLYAITGKMSCYNESKPLTIDIGKGETVYIEISTKSHGSPLEATLRMLTKKEMVFCKMVKREFIEKGKVASVEVEK